MAQRGIREFHAKKFLSKFFEEHPEYGFSYDGRIVLVTPESNFEKLAEENSWLKEGRLVAKPDMLFGKRGKHGLVLLNATFDEAVNWVQERMNKEVQVGKTKGVLTHFLIEPFVPHEKEYYVAIKTEEEGDRIYFSDIGGIDIEENWEHVEEFFVPIEGKIEQMHLEGIDPLIESFIKALYNFFVEYDFTYLEINPFAINNGKVVPLDFVARLDDTALFKDSVKWGDVEFPTPFGRSFTKEEQYIRSLDEKTGASLKLTILNPDGHVWLMVAGGGASVIYTDTVVDLGFGQELANYGEYSGDPTEQETYEYAKTILDLMTRNKDEKGKVLIIGGGIANFTDVAKTFKGIIRALTEYKDKLKENNVKIFVRRGGPNYKEGLKMMEKLGADIGVPIEVYGPDLHMTRVVKMALGGEK
ncbi:MAG: ATP citrate lyase citrate-binding domain-containing protein [Caldisericaceae bacterium]